MYIRVDLPEDMPFAAAQDLARSILSVAVPKANGIHVSIQEVRPEDQNIIRDRG